MGIAGVVIGVLVAVFVVGFLIYRKNKYGSAFKTDSNAHTNFSNPMYSEDMDVSLADSSDYDDADDIEDEEEGNYDELEVEEGNYDELEAEEGNYDELEAQDDNMYTDSV